MNILFVVGIAQGLFFILFLLLKKENKFSNRLLALLVFLISFSLFLTYSYSTALILKFPHLIGLDNANPFLIPPIIYFYAKSLTAKRFRFKWKDGLHLLPFAIYFLYVLLTFFLQDASYKIDYLDNLRNLEIPTDLLISSFAKIIQAIAYLSITNLLLKKHTNSIRSEFSYTEGINLYWLKIIILSITIIYAIRLCGILLSIMIDEVSPGFVEGGMELVNVVFIYIMVYFGLTQSEIFKKWNDPSAKPSLKEGIPQIQTSTKTKYASSVLSKERSIEILDKLEEYMKLEKPYLNNELTIKDVAVSLDVHTKSLSQVINEHHSLNFFNFINKYRVEEVKAKLLNEDYAHYSVLGIALESGFSSKSSFNSVFKKVTGQTPTAYKSMTS